MVISFSEAMDPLSLNDTNIGLLVDQNGDRVPVTRLMSADMLVVTLDPAILLDMGYGGSP